MATYRLAAGLCCLLVSIVFAVALNTTILDPNFIPIYNALIGKSSYKTYADVDQLLKSIEELSDIQRQLLNITDGSEKEKNKYPTDKFKRRLYNLVRKKTRPMNLPYLFQGDIVLTPEEMAAIITSAKLKLIGVNDGTTVDREKHTPTADLDKKWNVLPIPYFIDKNVNRRAIIAGMKLWTDTTCISFEEKANTAVGINFIKAEGCYSNIGMHIGRQFISIGEGCEHPGIIAHEIAHALGNHHEQSRFDRDDYVNVVYDYVIQSMEGNYIKYDPNQTADYGVSYDYGSIMHYDKLGLSYTNQTIYPVDPNFSDTIGQRETPSFNDVKKINFAYCNDTCLLDLICQHNGYTDPKNCEICRCPEGFSGDYCEEVTESSPSCGNQLLAALNEVITLTQSGNLTCYYLIRAIPGRSVNLYVNEVGLTDSAPCAHEYLELRYGGDMGATGARLCGQIYEKSIISETNEILVIYKSQSIAGNFNVSYSIGGITNKTEEHESITESSTTTTPMPTTTTTTEATTTTTTTTTPQSTTTETAQPSLITTLETTPSETPTTSIPKTVSTPSPIIIGTTKTLPVIVRHSGAMATITMDNSQWPFTACKENSVNITIPYKYNKMARIERDLGILITNCVKTAMVEIGKEQVETIIGEKAAPEKRFRIITTVSIDYSDLLNRIDIE